MLTVLESANRKKWDRAAQGGLLLALAGLCALTWRKWGYLPIDSGREAYIPYAIAQGKRLYFDLWYPYGPLIPYWHAALFRVFGIHLGVLLGAGLAVVLAASFLLYRVSRVFLPPAWSFAAVFAFLVQAFQADLFNYVLPYSYPAAYGSMLVVLLLWLILRKPDPGLGELFTAGLVAGLTMLTKLEFGTAAYAGLACWLLVRALRERSARAALLDATAIAPGALLVLGVYGWYLHALGADFFLGQNLSILPSSHFQQHFARIWNLKTGLDLSASALTLSMMRGLGGLALVPACLWAAARLRVARWILLAASIVSIVLYAGSSGSPARIAEKILRPVFFNSGMIWAGFALALMAVKRWVEPGRALLLATLAMACGVRSLTKMAPDGYAMFFDVLAYLMWLVAVFQIARRLSIHLDGAFGAGIAALCCAGVAALTLEYYPVAQRNFVVSSERGTLYTTPEIGKGFQEAIAFLERARRDGQNAVILPEDTFLYFFSGTLAPSRWYMALPQALAPGRLTQEYIDELDLARPRYILVSDRATPEFGLPLFGVDYAQPIQAWIEQHYRVVQSLGDYRQVQYPRAWGALVYERR